MQADKIKYGLFKPKIVDEACFHTNNEHPHSISKKEKDVVVYFTRDKPFVGLDF